MRKNRIGTRRGPSAIPPVPDGFFRLTQWRPAVDDDAAGARARFAAHLAAQGVTTITVHSEGFAALYRSGEEALSESGIRARVGTFGRHVSTFQFVVRQKTR